MIKPVRPVHVGVDFAKEPSHTTVHFTGGRQAGKTERLLDIGQNVAMPDGTVRGPNFARDITPTKEPKS